MDLYFSLFLFVSVCSNLCILIIMLISAILVTFRVAEGIYFLKRVGWPTD